MGNTAEGAIKGVDTGRPGGPREGVNGFTTPMARTATDVTARGAEPGHSADAPAPPAPPRRPRRSRPRPPPRSATLPPPRPTEPAPARRTPRTPQTPPTPGRARPPPAGEGPRSAP